MGCGASRQSFETPTPKTPSSPSSSVVNVKTFSTSDGFRSSFTSKEITHLEEFKITHADFIREKTGKIEDDYSLLSPPISRGPYGEVRRAIHKKTNVIRAVKIIFKDRCNKEDEERIINEVNMLAKLDHPNIMKIIEFYQDNKALYIISEFYNGGELFEKIVNGKNFSEKQAAITIKQILSAVNYCHQNSIVHRDLKPENVIFESKREDAPVKIIDFGLCKDYTHQLKSTQKFGTPYYFAPEILKNKYTEKCDIWSCGVILYILLCGYPPFSGDNNKMIMSKVATGKYGFEHAEWQQVSNEAKKFIKKLLEYNPDQRYSASQALNDPWFKMILGETADRNAVISALKNLRQFKAERKLQEATWIFLVTHLASKDEKNQLLSSFQMLDLNGDGKLSREELVFGYEKILGLMDARAEVDAIFRAIDYNNSGSIDYTEFVLATINRQKLLSKERLEAIFKLFDQDGNGYLTTDELKEIFNPGNSKEIDEKVWPELIKEVDQNGDGKVSFKEFKEMMLNLL